MAKGLSDSDITILQRLIDEEKRRNPRGSSRHSRESFPQDNEGNDLAPEVYVVKTPSGGLVALTTTTGTGTGTGTGDGFPEPGSGECDVNVIDLSGVADLRDIGKDVEVYNVSGSAIEGGVYLPAMRDKFGRWLAITGGSCNTKIQFETVAAGPFFSDSSVDCKSITAEVIEVSCCNNSGVAVGDEITIWDPYGCWFNIPIEVLENTRGQASQMASGASFGITECLDSEVEGCWWLVENLCCAEEVSGS